MFLDEQVTGFMVISMSVYGLGWRSYGAKSTGTLYMLSCAQCSILVGTSFSIRNFFGYLQRFLFNLAMISYLRFSVSRFVESQSLCRGFLIIVLLMLWVYVNP